MPVFEIDSEGTLSSVDPPELTPREIAEVAREMLEEHDYEVDVYYDNSGMMNIRAIPPLKRTQS